MTPTHRRILPVLVAATSVLALTSCGTDGSASPQRGSLAADAAANAKHSSQPALQLGDLNADAGPDTRAIAKKAGAPFDPCSTVTWNDFPPKARGGVAPIPKPPGDAGYAVGCSWRGKALTLLVWGRPPGMPFKPNEPGKTPVTFGRKPGFHEPGKTGRNQPMCHSRMQLTNGVAGVSTTVMHGSKIDPCKVNTSLLTAIADRT